MAAHKRREHDIFFLIIPQSIGAAETAALGYTDMMKIHLFDVTESFQIKGTGLILMPGISSQIVMDSGLCCLWLKKPDHTILEAVANIYYNFPCPTPDNPMMTFSFPNLSKSDVPIGTEVWLPSDPFIAQDKQIDYMHYFIEKDTENSSHVDYYFSVDLTAKDPRYRQRRHKIAVLRGLLRITKDTLDGQLLEALPYDNQQKCYMRVLQKILKEYKTKQEFPDKLALIIG